MNAESLVRGIGMTSERTRRRLIDQLRAEGIANRAVLEAIAATPRHLFVDEALSSRAYENSALPIGRGQTISQPLVVARMTEAVLGSGRLGKVLEIGTGSGYQSAILARLADQVFTTERIGELARQAKQRLHRLKLHNVYVRHLDGLPVGLDIADALDQRKGQVQRQPADQVATQATQNGRHGGQQRQRPGLVPARQHHRCQHHVGRNRKEHRLGETQTPEIAARLAMARPGQHTVVDRTEQAHSDQSRPSSSGTKLTAPSDSRSNPSSVRSTRSSVWTWPFR
jgi:protein-L-isoaspartate(D-aspartate) O-methyltransferase